MKNEGQLYGLIGHPLSHSFSAAYFKNKFEKSKLPHAYLNFDQDPIPDLALLIEKHPNLRGLNVTIPYKEAILNQLHEIEPEAGIIGAVNVISIKDGRTKGYNTDTEAFFKSLKPLLTGKEKRALILGTGGASRAVSYALKKNGIDYTMVSRKSKMSGLNYALLNEEMMFMHDIIVNTTPLGTYPDINSCPPIPYEALASKHILFDLVYNPELSLFLKKGLEHSCTIKNGLEMLEIQAELSWQIWNQ